MADVVPCALNDQRYEPPASQINTRLRQRSIPSDC